MGKHELKNEILSVEEVFKVIEFIVFGISNDFISRRTPLHWKKAVDEFYSCKKCGITYFKRMLITSKTASNKIIISQNGESVTWKGFSPDELTPPKTGRDVCWILDNDLASFLEAIYEFKLNHL